MGIQTSLSSRHLHVILAKMRSVLLAGWPQQLSAEVYKQNFSAIYQ